MTRRRRERGHHALRVPKPVQAASYARRAQAHIVEVDAVYDTDTANEDMLLGAHLDLVGELQVNPLARREVKLLDGPLVDQAEVLHYMRQLRELDSRPRWRSLDLYLS